MHHETYFFTRSSLIRIAAFVYFAAFLVAFNQNGALIGENGLLPGDVYLDKVSQNHKHPLAHRNRRDKKQSTKHRSGFFQVIVEDDDEEDLPIAKWCSISETSIFYRDLVSTTTATTPTTTHQQQQQHPLTFYEKAKIFVMSGGKLPSSIDDNFIVQKAISNTIDTCSCFLSRKLLGSSTGKSTKEKKNSGHELAEVAPLFGRSATLGGLPSWSAFREAPTLLWWAPQKQISTWLNTVAAVGMAISATAFVFGGANAIMMLGLWVLYFSIVSVGQQWYSFGWESQLLETGFLLVFCVPFVRFYDVQDIAVIDQDENNDNNADGSDENDNETRSDKQTSKTRISINTFYNSSGLPVLPRYLLRYLLFRVLFGAGMIKMKADPCWSLSQLSCMNHHYETQPVPNPLSILFHSTPPGFHRFETLCNHVVELIASVMLMFPFHNSVPAAAGCCVMLFMSLIIMSGNLVFLNWLTMIPAFACFPDSFWHSLFSEWMKIPDWILDSEWCLLREYRRRNGYSLPTTTQNNKEHNNGSSHYYYFDYSRKVSLNACMKLFLHTCLFITIMVLSIPAIENLLSPNQRMNDSHHWLKIVNSHGNFGSITKDRPEIIIQGRRNQKNKNNNKKESTTTATTESTTWKTYEFFCKPTKKSKTPCLITPYHYRLDWMMWFCGFTGVHHPWMGNLLLKMLKNEDKQLLRQLIAVNPFDGAEESGVDEIRVLRVNYRFNLLPHKSEKQILSQKFQDYFEHDWDWKPFFDTFEKFIAPKWMTKLLLFFDKNNDNNNHFDKVVDQHYDIWKEQGNRETLIASITVAQLETFVKAHVTTSPLKIIEDEEEEKNSEKEIPSHSANM